MRRSFSDRELNNEVLVNSSSSGRRKSSSFIENIKKKIRPNRLQLYKVKPKIVGVCTVNIVKAENVTNGFFNDTFIDTPDTYVETITKSDYGILTQQTNVIDNCINPEFNMELKSVFDPKNDPNIEINLKESNYTEDDVLGTHIGKLSEIPNELQFGKSSLHINTECHEEKPNDLHYDLNLSKEEETFRSIRRKHVFESMRKLLGERGPKDISEVPTIAVIGSGGGFRALLGLSSVFNVLFDNGILDCVMYTASLSGSSWYMTTLYSHPDWPNIHPSVVQNEVLANILSDRDELINYHLQRLPSYVEEILKKINHGLPYNFTDLFGHMIAETLIPGRKMEKWSDQAQKLIDGKAPLPFVTCINVDETQSAEEFHEWIELSPFDMAIPKYGVSLDMKNVGSHFFKGILNRQEDEPPLHFIQGICGSAYTILQCHKSFIPQPKLMTVNSLLKRWNIDFLDGRKGRAGEIPNILRQLSLEIVDQENADENLITDGTKTMTNQDYMYLIDAGLAFNAPYPVVLRPERKVDLIISFEYSDRGSDRKQPFDELISAKKWADERGLPFPEINVSDYDEGFPDELYIFEDSKNPDCPIIMHFVLVNNQFRFFSEPGCKRNTEEEIKDGNFTIFDDKNKPYDSMKFHYTKEEATRLIKLVEFNTKINLEKIKDCIESIIKRKRR